MEIIFHSHANKTNFHKKGWAPSEGFWNSEVAYSVLLDHENCGLEEKMVEHCTPHKPSLQLLAPRRAWEEDP